MSDQGVERQAEQIVEAPADQWTAVAGQVGAKGGLVGAQDGAAAIDRQQPVDHQIGQFPPGAEPDDPVAPGARQKIAVLHQPGRALDQFQGKHLAAPVRGRRHVGHVEHAQQRAGRVEDGRHGAGQPCVESAEMLLTVDDQRLVGGDAGADAVGALLRLGPDRSQIKPGLLQFLLEAGLAEVIDGDAVGVGQDHHVVRSRDLRIKTPEFGGGDADELLHGFKEPAEFSACQHHRTARPGGVQPVAVQTARPGSPYQIGRLGILAAGGFGPSRYAGDDKIDVLPLWRMETDHCLPPIMPTRFLISVGSPLWCECSIGPSLA